MDQGLTCAGAGLAPAPARPADIGAAVRLLQDAVARGWLVSWRAYDPASDASAMYVPPGPVSVGVVKAFDEHRTLTATGVAMDDAVAQIREFLDWPEGPPASTTTGDKS